MRVLHIDVESRSSLALDRVSTYRYASDESTEVLCVAYAVDDGEIALWTPGAPVPDEITAADHDTVFAAHNANFEFAILNRLLAPRFGWPAVPLTRFVCTMARARAAALPGSLDGAAAALGLDARKDKAGAKLMREIASRKREPTAEDLDRLAAYCRQDVTVERELFRRLPPLSEEERTLWALDHKINQRGLPIDRALAIAVADLAKTQRIAIDGEISSLTGGVVATANQRDRILAWITADGGHVDSLAKADVAKALANGCGDGVRKLLELRAIGSQAAASKSANLLVSLDDDDRLRETLVFHGAATGRWSGRRFQPQNLRRVAKGLDVEGAIAAIKSGGNVASFGQPLSVAADVSRGLICAPEGYTLIGADFSAVESRVLAWLADDRRKLKTYIAFDETGDPELEPYCVTASKILGRKVTPADSEGRAIGKTADLALGFGGSVGAWRKLAPNDKRTDDEIKSNVAAWRAAHPKITKFWNELETALKRAIRRPGKKFSCGRIDAECRDGTLWVTLPSGRSIAYPEATLVPGKFEDTEDIQFRDNAKGLWRESTAWYGIFVENAVQATARDLMAAAMIRLEEAGFPVIATVHDEIICEIPESTAPQSFLETMTSLPPWAKGLPIAGKQWSGKRFIKSDSPTKTVRETSENCGEAPETNNPEVVNTVRHDDEDAPPWVDDIEYEEQAPEGEEEAERPKAEETPKARNNYVRQGTDDAGKPYAPVRAMLIERGYRLTKSFPFVLPGEAEPMFFEDRYEKVTKEGRLKECRFRHVRNGAELCDTGPRRILYGLPGLMKAELSAPVFLTGGAAKCEPLIAAGLVAVAAPYHTFKDECATALAGRRVIYLEDHDLPDAKGRVAAKEFSERARQQLLGLAASFRIVAALVLWKDLGKAGDPPHGWDVKDWLAAGGKAERLVDMGEQQGTKDDFGVCSAADLQHEEFADIKYIIPGFVAEGVTLFAGKPKIGKSWLVLHACWAVATGGTTLGSIQVGQGDVIYAALEDNKRRMKSRLTRLLGKEPWPRELEFVYHMKKLKEGGIAQLRSWIMAKPNPRLVVIDTLKMVRTPAPKGQSYYEADYEAILELRDLAAEFGIAIIIVHHQRKAEADDIFDTVSGTLGLTGAVDTILIIDRTGNGTVLSARGRDVEEISQAVEFDNCCWRITGDAAFVQVSGERKQIVEVLEEADGTPMSANEIARIIGAKANSVGKLLYKMAKEGMVVRKGYGKYVLDTGLGS